MKEVCKRVDCTGCGLCAVSCPKKSIMMQSIDRLGHLFPVIDQSSCVDCGLCQKVCPSLKKMEANYPQNCFAAWAKDEEDYKSSTSGAVASVLSQYILSQGGVVYGCAMLPNVEVKHIRVDSLQGLSRLKGSKYVQSRIDELLPQIRDDINRDKKVLFIGTPCQCGAVKGFFKEQPTNLYLVDLICHGVPSLAFLQNHVKNTIGTIEGCSISFRDMDGAYVLKIIIDGEVRYKMPLKPQRYKDLYLNTFFDGFTFRDSCYACKYAKPERAFDMTIGDFWGLGKKLSTAEIPPHPYGCSVLLPSSDKGLELIEAIRPFMNIYVRPVIEAIEGNHQLYKPSGKHKNRIKTYRWLVRHGFPLGATYKLVNVDFITKHIIRQLIKR